MGILNVRREGEEWFGPTQNPHENVPTLRRADADGVGTNKPRNGGVHMRTVLPPRISPKSADPWRKHRSLATLLVEHRFPGRKHERTPPNRVTTWQKSLAEYVVRSTRVPCMSVCQSLRATHTRPNLQERLGSVPKGGNDADREKRTDWAR